MAALLAVYHLFLEREKMHRFNRFYLLLSLVFALALPFVSIPIYVEAEAAPKVVTHVTETPVIETMHLLAAPTPTVRAAPVTAAPKPEINYWPYIILVLYGIVTLALTIRFAINITRFYRIRKKSETSIYNNATLVLVKENVLPHTFLNNIYLSKADYESHRIEPELFTHELTHVKQRHTLDILFIEVLKILFWFNPILYLYKRAIQLNHEFLADETTLQHHFNVSAYQHLLLGKATPATAYALASSINFSITKKRFIMMTKTTNKAKSIVLKTALLPTAALLLYFLSTETITHTKTTNSTHKKVVSRSTPMAHLMPDVITTDAPEEEDAPIAETSQQNAIDTTTGEARRAEYFKGVKIVIEDATRNVFIKMPFEKLPLEHKQYYLNGIPEKKVGKPLSESSYEFTFKQKNAVYYIDEQKVTREEALKYKREDFYSSGYRAQGTSGPDGETTQQFQMFLFTKPYFEKKLKHINDHYPDKVYTVIVTAKPEDTNKEFIEAMNKRDASGKTGSELEEEKFQAKLKADKYNYIDEIAERDKGAGPQFPGDLQAFKAYVNRNFHLPEKYTEKVMVSFTVNTDGSLSGIIVTGLDDETKQKLEQVVKVSPRWVPAQKKGKAIKCDTSVYIEPQKK